ncbi:MAG: alpha/beta fold hydrolase [Polyangiaceae bacterium]
MRGRILATVSLVGLLACGSNDEHATTGAGGGQGGSGVGGMATGVGGGGGDTGLSVSWAACPSFTDGEGDDAECAQVSVPLDWATPEGRRIELFVKRMPATEPERGAVWLLAGGPGQPGSDFEGLVQAFAAYDPSISYYMLDHRGVGRSSRLSCPIQEAVTSPGSYGITLEEFPACLDAVRQSYSDAELAFFSTTQAAEDVAALIAATRVEGAHVAVWGGSYGSHWINRYLLLHPDQPDVALLSAIATESPLSAIDTWMDGVTRRYLTACQAGLCGDKYGAAFGDAVTPVAEATIAGEGTTFCGPIAAFGWTPGIMKTLFGQWMYTWELRKLVPAVLYRLARCNGDDVAALQSLAVAYSQPPPDPLPAQQRLWGAVLGPHIILSEMWDDTTTDAAVSAFADSAIAIQGAPANLVALHDGWPRYTSNESGLATSPTLTRLFQGDFDFIPSAVYQPVVDHYLGLADDNRFTLLPRAPHGLASPVGDGTNCSLTMIRGVLTTPSAPLVDCSDQVLPFDFVLDASVSSQLLGTPDAWDGAPSAAARATPRSPVVAESVLRFQRDQPEAVARLRAVKP